MGIGTHEPHRNRRLCHGRRLRLLLIREDFHGIEGKQAPLSREDIAKLRNLTIEEVEAAIAFPW